jgi:desulfoferrodoxin-like iron-binding protein
MQKTRRNAERVSSNLLFFLLCTAVVTARKARTGELSGGAFITGYSYLALSTGKKKVKSTMVNVSKEGQVYRCEICGNVVVVREVGGGELVCCGEPMQLESE